MSIGEWLYAATTLISAVTAAVVTIINAVRTRAVHRQVVPPSQPKGGRTLGDLIEGVSVSAHAAAIESSRVRKLVAPGLEPPPLEPPAPPT